MQFYTDENFKIKNVTSANRHVTDSMQQTVANAMVNLITEKETEQRNNIIKFTA